MGDRKIECGYVYEHLPGGQGTVFDFGPSPSRVDISLFAISQGYSVTAVGLEQIQRSDPRLLFIHGDLLEVEIAGKFDWVLNISTVEHCGLVGRYGITVADADADLKAMRVLGSLMGPSSRMLMTVPVGLDTVVGRWHRVYGEERLPRLLEGYEVLHQAFWAKPGDEDVFRPVSELVALRTRPIQNPPRHNYYALGAFTLRLQR